MIFFWNLDTFELIKNINFQKYLDSISLVTEISKDKITVLSKTLNRYYIINTSSYQIESVINYKSKKTKESEGVVISFDEYNLLCCLKNDSFDLFNSISFIQTNYKEEIVEKKQEDNYNYNRGNTNLFGGFNNNHNNLYNNNLYNNNYNNNNYNNNNVTQTNSRDFTNVIKINTNTIVYALGFKFLTNTLVVN